VDSSTPDNETVLGLHRKMVLKTNVLNNLHVSQLLHYKTGLLQNDGIIIYLQSQIQVTGQVS
jgi:hypothetical protein